MWCVHAMYLGPQSICSVSTWPSLVLKSLSYHCWILSDGAAPCGPIPSCCSWRHHPIHCAKSLTWRLATRLRSRTKGDAELTWVYQLAGMSQVALVGYAVGGAFLSLAYFDLPYNIMVILVVTDRWLAQRHAPPLAAATVLPGGKAPTRPDARPLPSGRNSQAGPRLRAGDRP